MIDDNLKAPKKETVVFPPIPENIYQAELLDVTSNEVETYRSKTGKTEEKEYETVLKFQFTLLNGKDGEDSLRGRNVWHNFVPMYLYVGKNGKNHLYKIVEALSGSELTPEEEAEGIDGAFLNGLIGKQCRLGIKHKKKDDKVYDNIETYYAIENEVEPLSDEEKEKATVKERDDKKGNENSEKEKTEDDINSDDIPFDN